MGTGGWTKGMNSSDLGSLVISVRGCVGLLWFAVRTKNLLEEEKRGGGVEAVKTQVASVIFGFLNRLIALLIYTVLILYF